MTYHDYLSLKVTWPFDYLVLQDHVINQTHYISTNPIPISTKIGRVVPYCERLQTLKQHEPFIMWLLTCSRVAIWKIYLSTFTVLMATKLGRVMTSGRSFNTQTLKLLPTSCCFLFLFFFLMAVFGWTAKIVLGTFYYSLPRNHVTKTGFISLDLFHIMTQ